MTLAARDKCGLDLKDDIIPSDAALLLSIPFTLVAVGSLNMDANDTIDPSTSPAAAPEATSRDQPSTLELR
jgi:hypothetical protein